MCKYRGRQTQIVLGEPLSEKPLPLKPVLRNTVAEALRAKAFLGEDTERTYLHASQRFKVTKARISTQFKITEVFVTTGFCELHGKVPRSEPD